jgi:hypothetical protein
MLTDISTNFQHDAALCSFFSGQSDADRLENRPMLYAVDDSVFNT